MAMGRDERRGVGSAGPALADDLAAIGARAVEVGSPFPAAYDAALRRLAKTFRDTAPVVGELMPPFLLVTDRGRLVALDEVLAAGPALISFNRGHWCSYCEAELAHYARHHREFAAFGARILAITPERQAFSRPFAEKFGGAITVLTDMDNGYALSLGLVMPVDERVRQLMCAGGCELDRYQGNGAWLLPIPGTFLVEAGGQVAARFVDIDFRKRLEVREVLACLASLRR